MTEGSLEEVTELQGSLEQTHPGMYAARPHLDSPLLVRWQLWVGFTQGFRDQVGRSRGAGTDQGTIPTVKGTAWRSLGK